MNALFQKIMIPLSGFILSLLLVEVVVRCLEHPKRQEVVNRERPAKYYLPEHSPSLRGNPPNTETKGPGEFRVSVVGDSFTFGPKLQVDDTFPSRLERLLSLNEDSGKVRVINYGTPGYATHHEVPLLKRAAEAGSDVVLLQITLNDLQSQPLKKLPKEFGGACGAGCDSGFLGMIVSHWHTLRFVLDRIQNAKSVDHYIQYHLNLFTNEENWHRFVVSVHDAKRSADEHHAAFGAVIFPLFDFPIDAHYPFAPIHEKLLAFFNEEKIPVLDLRAAFEGLAPARLQLIPGKDSHPNEIAHRIAAESIYEWLGERELIPARLRARTVYRERDSVYEGRGKLVPAASEEQYDKGD